MSSTNKTKHLGLNHWDGGDPFQMEDFNRDNAILDSVVGGVRTGVGNLWYIIATQKWTVPFTGLYKITCFGGGGGGRSSGGRGGDAGYMAQKIVALTQGDSHTITIGLGGLSGATGGATSFGTLVSANGGGFDGSGSASGGAAGAAGADNSAYGYVTGYGGRVGGHGGKSGGGGGGGGFMGSGGFGGNGGNNSTSYPSPGGAGGNGTGFASGGGGGGTSNYTSGSGGNGAPGICIVEFLETDIAVVTVMTNPSARVTATLGETTIGPVIADTDGNAQLVLPESGEWTVTAELSGESESASVTVAAARVYEIALMEESV